jgi:hypothetical protein
MQSTRLSTLVRMSVVAFSLAAGVSVPALAQSAGDPPTPGPIPQPTPQRITAAAVEQIAQASRQTCAAIVAATEEATRNIIRMRRAGAPADRIEQAVAAATARVNGLAEGGLRRIRALKEGALARLERLDADPEFAERVSAAAGRGAENIRDCRTAALARINRAATGTLPPPPPPGGGN